MKKQDNHKHYGETFPGFPPEPVTNYWPYPKALNGWWHALTPTEQKVLDYILRHTWGYKKDADAISLSQFINGITKRDGTVIDKGTGIKDERTVRKSLKGLVSKCFINRAERKGYQPIFSLKIDPSQEMIPPSRDDTTPLAQHDRGNPSHNMPPTIKDRSIKDSNIINISQDTPVNKKYSSIKDIQETDLQQIAENYRVPLGLVKLQFEKLQNWCEAKGKRYKNYKKALANWVLTDMQKQIERGANDKYRGIDARHVK